VITGDATATAHDLADGSACLRINNGDCGTGNLGGGNGESTDSMMPSVIADGNAEVASIPTAACARVNAGDCAGAGSGTPNTGVPVITGDATATVSDLVDGVVCVRVNGGACGTDDQGTGDGGANTTGSVVPSLTADANARVADIPVDACARINAGDCGDGADTGTGTDVNPIVPTIVADVTATARDGAVAGICLSINGGDCGIGGGGADGPGTGGGDSDGDGRRDPDGAGSVGGDSETAGSGMDGPDVGGAWADGSVGGTFSDAIPVATVGGITLFGDGVAPGLVGGNTQLVSGQLTGNPTDDGKDPRLAHTGSSATMLVLLVGGLLSMLMSALLLGWRRRN
jgi:LPXTG-motif cell wall-anchored protein